MSDQEKFSVFKDELIRAISGGKADKVKYLVSTLREIIKDSEDEDEFETIIYQALSYACKKGDAQIVHFFLNSNLVEHLEWIDESGDTPLLTAVSRGNAHVMELLLQDDRCNNNTVNMTNLFTRRTVLHDAIKYDNGELVYLLIWDGRVNCRGVDFKGNTPLHQSLQLAYFNESVFLDLLHTEARYDMNQPNHDGTTPFHLIVSRELEKACRMASKYGNIDFNRSDNEGNTPLHLACANRSKKIVVSLLKTSAINDLHRRNNNGETPFLCACRTSSPTKYYLLKRFQDINIYDQDHSGYTPIKWAFINIDEDFIQYMVHHGCNHIDLSNLEHVLNSEFEFVALKYPKGLNIRSLDLSNSLTHCLGNDFLAFVSSNKSLVSLKIQGDNIHNRNFWYKFSRIICKNNCIVELDSSSFEKISQKARTHIKINQMKRFQQDVSNLWQY